MCSGHVNTAQLRACTEALELLDDLTAQYDLGRAAAPPSFDSKEWAESIRRWEETKLDEAPTADRYSLHARYMAWYDGPGASWLISQARLCAAAAWRSATCRCTRAAAS